ncbi:MAG: undecaprenyl-diphosphate phosphatase [Christensenellales bacterium]|jgi:undecaprenyl-diphosphatase
MSSIQAVLFGLVQGLTEFLPVSSSGHMSLLRVLLGIEADIPVAMDVVMHVGTLIAVIVAYRKRIWDMLRHPLQSELPLLALATVPAVAAVLICKFAFHIDVDEYFDYQYLGFFFLLTTLILWFADLLNGISAETKEVRWYNALAMGVTQIFGLLTGVSRSGSALAGGIATGLSRKRATDFAFLMAIPAILGALVFDIPELASGEIIESVGALQLVIALVVSGGVGFLSIQFMLKIIRRVRVTWFGVYTGILGAAILLDQYVFHIFFKL